MSRLFLICLFATALSGRAAASLPPSGKDIIKMMQDRYTGKWYHSFTFTQTTQVYRNDTLRSTQTWHEFIRNPDRFRMDFGPADSGNAVIFRGDSAYRFRNGELKSTSINNNEGLIFLLGGMYFYPFDQTCQIISDSLHFDLGTVRQDTWNGSPVYIIGKEGANQLYIDTRILCPVRMINASNQLDARFEDWQPLGGGFCETKCDFYLKGKLIQTEIYHDLKADIHLDDRIFDPSKLNKSW